MHITSEHLRFVSLLAIFTIAYVLTGMVGLFIQTGHDGITPIWPPSGIALYALLRFGPRMWPLVFISIVILGWHYSIPPLSVMLAAIANTCEVLLGWQLCRNFGIEFGKRLRDTWLFLLLPVLLAPLAGASIGSLGMILGGAADWQALPVMWLMWWLGDACGILLFTPLLYAWVKQPSWFQSVPRLFEWLIVTGFSVFLGWYTFVYEQQQLPGETIDIMFLVTPFLLWASIRLGLRGATLVSLIACSWVLWGAANATGPFAMDDVWLTGMLESSFILVITLTALVVQSLFREHMFDVDSIRSSNEALARRVRQRTTELENTNKELTAAKEAAEQANASKTRFLVAASHDLRQPLQAITTHTDILGLRSSQPQVAENIEQLRNASRSMARILDKLAEISKLESGEVSRDIRVFDIDVLLDELRKQHTPAAAAKRLTLQICECDRNIRSDYTLLLQILQNLISNAISYTNAGSITVGCHARDGMLRIAVTDTGIGIQETDRDAIFEEFCQLNNPARDRNKGMGMGLAIVRRLAGLLDLTLHLDSAPGHGSTFAIDVPLAAGMPAHAGETGESTACKPVSPRETILLIDDDASVRHSQQMLLEAMGYRVRSAADADGARRLVGNRDDLPDLIISDYRLPEGETGSSLVERLRADTGRRIPAIILTGDVTLASLEGGPADLLLLRKPVATGELEQSIRQQLADIPEQLETGPAGTSGAGQPQEEFSGTK